MTKKQKDLAPWISIALALLVGMFSLVGWVDHEFARKGSVQRIDRNVEWIKNYLINKGG